jgi:hypothetical protein
LADCATDEFVSGETKRLVAASLGGLNVGQDGDHEPRARRLFGGIYGNVSIPGAIEGAVLVRAEDEQIGIELAGLFQNRFQGWPLNRQRLAYPNVRHRIRQASQSNGNSSREFHLSRPCRHSTLFCWISRRVAEPPRPPPEAPSSVQLSQARTWKSRNNIQTWMTSIFIDISSAVTKRIFG